MIAPGLENAINEGRDAQAVLPVAVIYGLFEFFVDPIRWALLVLTAMICIVSGISILVSIYNSMSERRHEIAVMRALGADRWTVAGSSCSNRRCWPWAAALLGWLAGTHAVSGWPVPIDRRANGRDHRLLELGAGGQSGHAARHDQRAAGHDCRCRWNWC